MISSLPRSSQVWDVLSRLSIPLGSQDVILWHTFPVLIHLAQGDLRVRVAVLRCPLQPFHRFLKVGLSKQALLIPSTEPELRVGVSVLGSGQKSLPINFSPLRALMRRLRGLRSRICEWRKQRNGKQREQNKTFHDAQLPSDMLHPRAAMSMCTETPDERLILPLGSPIHKTFGSEHAVLHNSIGSQAGMVIAQGRGHSRLLPQACRPVSFDQEACLRKTLPLCASCCACLRVDLLPEERG